MSDSNVASPTGSPIPIFIRVHLLLNNAGAVVIQPDEVLADVRAANVIWRGGGLSFHVEHMGVAGRLEIPDYGAFVALEGVRWRPANTWIDVYYGVLGFANGVCSFPTTEPHAIAVHFERPPTTLAHEFGHYFNLYHTFQDDLPDTDSQNSGDPHNVMSYNRDTNPSHVHLTESQVRRARVSLSRDRAALLTPLMLSAT